MKADPEKLREFAERYAAAWSSQNPASVAQLFSPGASLTVNNDPPAVGRPAITAIAQLFMTTFPDMRVTMDQVRIQDGRIEFHWTLIGTNTGPGGTGNRVRISGFELWQMGGDGLIAFSKGHFDRSEYQRQLALSVRD
jgi:uncharacterized protein (TIGR02246 family)